MVNREMAHLSIQIHFIIATVFISCVASIEKQWIRSNTWNDPQNWNPPHLPCPGDKIVLGKDVVYIEKNVTVKGELTLPRNGEIVFGANSKMLFEKKSRRALATCSAPGVPVTFVGQTRKRWFNPLNWYIYQNGKKDVYMTKAAPYIDRIPCFNDKVSFPKETAFKVDIRDAIYIKEFAMGGQVIKNNSELQLYLSSEAGKERFNITAMASLTINKTNFCGKNSSECHCGNVKLMKICGSFSCPKSCKRRVRPFKDCCDHCGALMNFKYERTFNIKYCWDELRIYLAKDNKYSDVRLYMSPMNSTDMQILVTESEDGSNAIYAVKSIITYIKSKKSKACDGIKNMLAVIPPPPEEEDEEETSKGIVTLSVLVPIIIVALVILIATYVKKKRNSEISAMQFQNVDDISQYPGGNDIEMTHDIPSADLYPGVNSFENPSYKALSEKERTGEITDDQYDDIASPVYDIPLDFQCKQNYDKPTIPPRYVESNIDGLSNPMYTGDQESYLDPEDVERGNVNALYDEVLKDYPEKDTPDESVMDLESTYDNDSITKIKLELKSEFDVEVVGLGEDEPSYAVVEKEIDELTD